jgi:hypothetical protein
MGGPDASGVHLLGTEEIELAAGRLGPIAAAGLKSRGRAVPATSRVARACELARARQPTNF